MPQVLSLSTHSKNLIQPKSLGMVLQEAHLVSLPQIELALRDQIYYPYLRLGEILAIRGWIKQETADFFAQDWWTLTKQSTRKPLGYYLQKSALVEEKQIEAILEEQRLTGIRFGSVAVLQGLLNSQTLDFFLNYLFPKEAGAPFFVGKYQINYRKYQHSNNRVLIADGFKQTTPNRLQQNQPQVEELEESEIKWIG